MRSRDLRHYVNNSNSITASKTAHPGIKMRYVLKQKNGYGGADMLKFEGDYTWPLQTKGRKNAQDALNGTGYVNVAEFMNEWVADEAIRAEFPTANDYIEFKEDIIKRAEELVHAFN
uniref:Uncharacterized protein n=1 Tax=Favella ehrenbergii TaxID=182087 RepID=A0A7S3I5A2_9SPIT|mmetsp:Transcript_16462/g.22265  ORF Transcript_16462/g.22265 Transcript_16462/m.22265 type:complete len:117 (+) Transcript_16462:790-1140(+)